MTQVGSIVNPDAPRARAAAVGLVVVCAGALLAFRAWPAPLPSVARPLVGVTLFSSVLAASVLVPVRRGRGRVRAPIALAIGVAAVAGAAAAGGTPVPIVATWWTLPVSVLAAVAEEALFRRVAYAELERWGAAAAIVGSALLFAMIHVPVYGLAVLPVDLGAGLLFGWQRWATGSWVVPATTHAAANVVAMLR